MLRDLKPRRIVEVGAGFSTAVMLDVAERFLNGLVIDSIEPDPGRLNQLLRPGDTSVVRVHETTVQQIPMDMFTSLRANDILFIDSSHVMKVGSDVSLLVLDVLPRLSAGVRVHIHDIAWPFEYPLDWYRAGRAWNEAHALRAFLIANKRFEIVVFCDYLVRAHRDEVRRNAPLILRQRRGVPEYGNSACSLWMQAL